MLCDFDRFTIGNKAKIRIENMRARTPLSLLGMQPRIACVKRNYHSGLICGGVFRGLAGVCCLGC